MTPNSSDANQEFCGNLIGIWAADAPSCPRLKELIHCRNCEVFKDRAKDLLATLPPEGYLEDWKDILSGAKEAEADLSETVIIFRLGDEWLALPAAVIKEVTKPAPIHRIPHKSDQFLQGVVNIKGNLELCFSLAAIIWHPQPPPANTATSLFGTRYIVLHREGNWVFPVDEIIDIRRYHCDNEVSLPLAVTEAKISYLKSAFRIRDRVVGLIDDELLLSFLRRRLL